MESGHTVVFSSNGSFIQDDATQEIMHLEDKNGQFTHEGLGEMEVEMMQNP